MIHDALIPHHTLQGLLRYRDDHLPTGGFLRSVLENNLSAALAAADLFNREALRFIVGWCQANLPSEAWGSPAKVDAWLRKGLT